MTPTAPNLPEPTLTHTALTPAVAEEWSRLYHLVAEEDGSVWKPTPEELREGLAPSPAFIPERDTWAVWSGEEMVAFAQISTRTSLSHEGENNVHIIGAVHPQWRGRGIGSELLRVAEHDAGPRALAQHPDAPAFFNTHSTDPAPQASQLLTDNGYEIARYWFDMLHDLAGEFAEDPRTQPLTPALFEATRLAHNDAFSTHWGSGPITPEGWASHVTSSSSTRPDLSRIVVDGNEVLAYAIVSAATPGEAYFDLIGVRGKAQGRGLGRAIVTSSLAAIKADGAFHEAGLDVDADNPSGAGGLYRSAGFTNAAKKLTWRKPIA